MTGWRKRTIMEMAREAGAHDNGQEVRFVEPKYLERFAALVREDALAQPAPVQEPVAEIQEDMKGGGYVKWLSEDFFVAGTKLYTTPPAQPEERNFCPRCGKRTRDLTTIHTCTPPQENT
jgi:hypothetical protein